VVLFIGHSSIFLLAISSFQILGVSPPKIHFNLFRSWGPPHKTQISGIRAGYDSMGMRFSYIFQSQFFCRNFFGRRLCRSYLKHLVQNLQKQKPYLDSPRKITQFQKKWVESEFGCGDIVDLKSAILSEFL